MVFFALTRSGYTDLIAMLAVAPSPLWVNNDVLTPDEIKTLHKAKVAISHFTRHIDCTCLAEIEEAVETIQEHHLASAFGLSVCQAPIMVELPKA